MSDLDLVKTSILIKFYQDIYHLKDEKVGLQGRPSIFGQVYLALLVTQPFRPSGDYILTTFNQDRGHNL